MARALNWRGWRSLTASERINFGDVLCFSPTDLKVPGAQWCPVKAWSSVQGYCEFLWHDLPDIIETPFMLNIQWDSSNN